VRSISRIGLFFLFRCVVYERLVSLTDDPAPQPEQTPFSLVPPQDNAAQLIGEFKNTEAMIFGEAPSFDAILASIGSLEDQLNQP